MATNPSQGKLPVIRIENLGAGQKNVPFTFGQVFKAGAVMPGQGLAGQLSNGDIVPLQIDQKATHADGSVRHAIISGVLPTIFEKEERELKLVTAKSGAGNPFSLSQIPDGVVELTVDGTKYSTNGSKFGDVIEWISGGVVAEGIVCAELRDSKGNLHPHLTVRAGIRAYSTGHARIEVIVENTKTFAANARNFVYDVSIALGGKKVFEQKALEHYHHSRWRQISWIGEPPNIHIKHDAGYVIDTQAVSNYDRTIKPSEKAIADMVKKIGQVGPMKIGPVNAYMPATGGRDDIGPLPAWSVMYLLSADLRMWDVMIAAAEGAASWSIHMRDENTGYPLRVDNEKNKLISTHMNLSNRGPLPVPRFSPQGYSKTPYSHDTAHQPSLVYLPYLLTGEHYYLEELQFWAAYNPLETDPGYSGKGLGLVRWQQIRGQAWSLRTLGHAAYITPDGHWLKDYFTKQLENNLNYYHQTFVEANPNNLGLYDGSGHDSFQNKDGSAPWQDDFFTWTFGYLSELGFEKALPILKWKAKYPVGRMTAPGYCWIHGAAYHLKFRDASGKPVPTFAALYALNFTGPSIPHDAKVITHPKGLDFMSTICNSQAQMDWFAAAGSKWKVGRMSGYADSVMGYPANMQPALALAAQFDAQDADAAWEKFQARADKPDYSNGPQFAIIPRKTEVVAEDPPEEYEKFERIVRSVAAADGKIVIEDDRLKSDRSYIVVIMEE